MLFLYLGGGALVQAPDDGGAGSGVILFFHTGAFPL